MDSSGGFWRDYLRAAAIAVPLAGVLAWGWTEFQASQAAATQSAAPQNAEVASPDPIPEPQIAAPAEPAREPAGPFFGIRREGVVAAPSPVPARPVAVATDGMDQALMQGVFGRPKRGLARWLNVLRDRHPLRDDTAVALAEEGAA